MQAYLDLLKHILENGKPKTDRTGTGTLSHFGGQLRFDLKDGFPLVTTKKVHLKSIVHELLWFLKGETNIAYLREHGVSIWNEWADDDGELGPVYGKQWRRWQCPDGTVKDQVTELLYLLKNDPDSRRLIISAWNVADLKEMALMPCHALFQFHTFQPEGGGKRQLSCHLYQRSADIFLGVPFNIASYALLTLMIAQVTDMEAHEFVISFGDVHIYNNHIEQVKLQLTREPFPPPQMKLNPEVKDLFAFRFEDFSLENYQCHPAIKAPVAI